MLGRIEGRIEKGAVEDELVRQHHRLNGREFEQNQETVEDRGDWSAIVQGVTKSQT